MNKSAVFWLIVVFAFTSCLPKQEIVRQSDGPRPNTIEKKAERPDPADVSTTRGGTSNSGPTALKPGTSLAGMNYIARYSPIAIEEMNRHGIPASIKLAQGLLESGNGSSRLAVQANNHFGIKCTGDWSGGRTYQDDDAENDCFRVYQHAEDSFRDHSQFLLRRRYEKLFTLDKTDYRAWASGLKEAGYATNPRYADLLVDLIERYELYQYDQPGRSRSVVVQQPSQGTKATVDAVSKTKVVMKIHEVTDGETASSIASRYGLTVQELLVINGLRNQDVHRGQLLIVSKTQ